MKRFDCVVIGGGHNGLVAAAYLALAGKTVCVLERRAVLGGCSSTEELWPGFKVSPAAYVISLFLPRIIRDLRLKQYGLKILPRNPSSFTPTLDGRSLLLGPDAEINRKEISLHSTRDADSYEKYNRFLEEIAETLEPFLESPPPELFSPRRKGLGEHLRNAQWAWQFHKLFSGFGERLPAVMEMLVGAARPILERWFEDELLKATLATDAIIGAFASPSMPGTAYVLLHHVMGTAGGARGVWGYVQGGMGGLADALERACQDLHVVIRREADVRRIVVDRGTVQGVLLADNSLVQAPVVASTVDAH